MIIALSDTGGRTDATHSSLAIAQAFHSLEDDVTVVRMVEADQDVPNPFRNEAIDFIACPSIEAAITAIQDAQQADRTIIIDVPPHEFRNQSLRKLVTIPLIAVGPYASDENLALAMAGDRDGTCAESPTWFLGCRRSGNPAAFKTSMSQGGGTPRVLPVTLPPLTRAEAMALETGAPGGRILRSGLLLAACLLRLSNDPSVPVVAGPGAAARSEAERISLTADDRPFGERLRDLADALDAIAQGHAPTAEEISDAPVLDNWQTEILAVPILTGTVSTHPSIRNGRPVHTSQVFASDNATWARTLSRLYVLGAPASADRARPH